VLYPTEEQEVEPGSLIEHVTCEPGFLGLGLAAGAVTYFALNRLLDRRSGGNGGAGPALALGAFLDGIPEQTVLGIGIAAGEGVSVGLLVAIFVSNLPEAIGSSTEMKASGKDDATIRRLWKRPSPRPKLKPIVRA